MSDTFVRGYDSVRPVSVDERRAVPALATLRAIWVMALPAACIGIWGADWVADPAYFSAHLAMIRRFASETSIVG